MTKYFRRAKPEPKGRRIVSLTPSGAEDLDPMPLGTVADNSLRPPTLALQVERLNRMGRIVRGILPESEIHEDDYLEYLEDVEEDGISPYEVDAQKEVRVYKRNKKKEDVNEKAGGSEDPNKSKRRPAGNEIAD